jgi:hypothetical protein
MKDKQAMEKSYETDRWIRTITVNTTPPSLKDNTGDVDRLLKGIEKELGGEEVGIDLPLSREIPSLLREHHYHAEAILYQEHSSWYLVDILPPMETGSVYGLAVDLGTSMIAVRLLDLVTGEVKEETSLNSSWTGHSHQDSLCGSGRRAPGTPGSPGHEAQSGNPCAGRETGNPSSEHCRGGSRRQYHDDPFVPWP